MKGVVIDFAKSLGTPRVPTITDLICNDHRGNADSGRAADVHEGNERSWIDHKNPISRSKKDHKAFLKESFAAFSPFPRD